MTTEVLELLKSDFDEVAGKSVTPTDKNKSALVPTQGMRALLKNCQILPETSDDKEYTLREGKFVDGSEVFFTYYNSTRKEENRPPEPRIGRKELLSLIEIGDELYLCRRGVELFFYIGKKSSVSRLLQVNRARETFAESLDLAELKKRAKAGKSGPAKRVGASEQFLRDPYVAAFVRRRANYLCEMPGCSAEPFQTDNGRPYIEVHHIEHLADGGLDTIENCAAICPRCHRLLHFGKERSAKKQALKNYIDGLNNKES